MGACVSTQAAAAGNIRKKVKGRRQRKKELKKEAMETLSAESKNDALLALAPGRMFSNGASNMSCIFTQQGRKGINQDAMVVWEGFASTADTVFCGVFDGHGPYGHLVARRVRDSLPSKLVSYWREEVAAAEENKPAGTGVVTEAGHDNTVSSTQETMEMEAKEPEKHNEMSESPQTDLSEDVIVESDLEVYPVMFERWKESHLTAYRVMDKELRSHPGIDCFCSGTTAVTVLKQGQDLVIANVGDSRAIMGTKDENDSLIGVQLTVDLKPNLPQEAERIRQCKGRVFALHDEPEVSRVWLPFDNSPGLAMARAFGDFCLKDYGVIAVPELSYRHLTDRDQFIVLATDGVWDVLSNEEVVNIVASAPTRATAARSLVESAIRVWRLKYPTSKVDDCAVVCLYLDGTVSTCSPISGPILNEEKSSSKLGAPIHEDHNGVAQQPSDHHLEMVDPRKDRIVPDDGELTQSSHLTVSATESGPSDAAAEVGEITHGEPANEIEKSASRRQRKLADWLDADDDEEWSALEGVTRVNSLLNLPRFSGGDRRAEGSSKRAT